MPLVLSNTEWNRISGRLEKVDLNEKKKDYINSMVEASAKMTKHWPNSIENVNNRIEELRERKRKEAVMANEKFFSEYIARKNEERVRMLAEARSQLFKDKDAPKTLLSGFITADVHREWNRQTKFNKELKEQAKQKKNAYEAEQKVEYEKWKKRQHKKALQKLQNDIEVGNFVKEQERQYKEKLEKARSDEIALERKDNIRANEELVMFQEFELELKKRSQQIQLRNIKEALDLKRRHDKEIKIRDQLKENLDNIYVNSKHRIDCIRAKKEKEMKSERLKIVEHISGPLKEGLKKRTEKEKEIFEKSRDQILMRQKEKDEADAAKKAFLFQELKDMHKQCLQKEERLKHHNSTLASWEMLNRVKNEEKTEEFNNLEREQSRRKILKYREELIAQQNERKQREEKEREELRYFYGERAINMLEKADKEFFAHADDVVKECLNTDRPPFAVEKVVDNYKKLNRLYPMPEVSKATKENLERSKKAQIKIQEAKLKQNQTDFQYVTGPKDGIRNPSHHKQVKMYCNICIFLELMGPRD